MSGLTKIKKNAEFRKIYNSRKSVADRNMVLYFLSNDKEDCRFGFTVSKKIGNAVTRNRIRRLFGEVCRLNKEKFPVGYDFILLARREIVGLDFSQIEKGLLGLLKKLKINRG
jgi:ribonuclease P protein component